MLHLPSSQGVHALAAPSPADAPKRPAGQATHATAPLAPPGLNWPGRHCAHEPGPPPLQPQPGSTAQVELQPSPAAVPPSSQASNAPSKPSPHTAVSAAQNLAVKNTVYVLPGYAALHVSWLAAGLVGVAAEKYDLRARQATRTRGE